MRTKCDHGFFQFFEDKAGEVSSFMSLTKFDLVPHGTGFTFKKISGVPDYSIKGGDFLGAVATATYEGSPGDLFRANGFVFDFTIDAVLPISQGSLTIPLRNAGNYYLSTGGLIVPGSKTDFGRVSGFSGFYSFNSGRWAYSEVSFV